MFSECRDVIGLENGAVLDSMISASSSYHVDHTGPERARLNWVYGKFYFDIGPEEARLKWVYGKFYFDIGPERARLNWVYGKFYFDII